MTILRKSISILIVISFLIHQTGFAQVLPASAPAVAIGGLASADKFHPVHLRFIDFDRSAQRFNVLLDKGDVKESEELVIEQTTRDVMTYFFTGVQLPNSSFWVNLRPDSPDRIIDDSLAKTDIGRIMLAADVQLKKDLAAYTSPKTKEGKEYWDKLYKKAEELFGNEDISIPTITRPWIVPNEIILRDTNTNAYIYKATLKVLLESDYLKDNAALQSEDARFRTLNDYSSQLIKELILPKLSKDVNISKRYAPLRQVYFSLILAQWFKAKFKNTPALSNLNSTTPWSKETYFKQYQESFQEGEYNMQDAVQTPYGQTIKQYFSGGIQISHLDPAATIDPSSGPSTLAIAANSPINPARYMKDPQQVAITMRDGGFDLKLFLDDIAEGIAIKKIIMPLGELRDDYSIFVKGFDWTNTRRLAENAAYLLTALMERKQGIIRTLVLGPGAGLELTDIDSIARMKNHEVEIDTLGLTALPGFRLKKDSREISAMLLEHIEDRQHSLVGLVELFTVFLGAKMGRNIDLERVEFTRLVKKSSKKIRIPLSAIFALQNAGFPIYDELSEPFINQQLIVSLKDSTIPGNGPGKTYDLILDNHGGFFYTVMHEGLKEAVLAVEPLLDQNGIFYAEHIPWMEGETDGMEFDNVMVFVQAGNPCSLVIIRKDSSYMSQAMAWARGAERLSKSIYQVEDIGGFLRKIMSGAASSEGLSTVEADINPSVGAPVSLKDGGKDREVNAEKFDSLTALFITDLQDASLAAIIPGRDRNEVYLPTVQIGVDHLPPGYSTSNGLRPEKPLRELPASLNDIPRVDAIPSIFNGKHVIPVSYVDNGTEAIVRLGQLAENLAPVVLKTYPRQADQVLSDYQGAQIADDLGIGPAVHGVFVDEKGLIWTVTDLVTGDFPEVDQDIITQQSVADFEEIHRRLLKHDIFPYYDFQYFITREGHVWIIDPMSLVIYRDAGNDVGLGHELDIRGQYAEEYEKSVSMLKKKAGLDSGSLKILRSAFNSIEQLPRNWQATLRKEYNGEYPLHRQLAQQYKEVLSRIGSKVQNKMAAIFPARAENIGPVILNPASGGDVSLFGLSEEITDIIGIDLKPFGSKERITTPKNTLKPVYKERYLTLGTEAMEALSRLSDMGNIIVERIMTGLDGRITGIYYFTIDEAGVISFADAQQTSYEENCRNAVVEYTGKDGQSKRYWHIQQDLNKHNPALKKFLEQTAFQTVVLKSAFDMFSPDSAFFLNQDSLMKTIIDPAKLHKAWIIHDGTPENERGYYSMWKIKPYSIPLERMKLKSGEAVQPTFGCSNDFVYWGAAENLIDIAQDQQRDGGAPAAQIISMFGLDGIDRMPGIAMSEPRAYNGYYVRRATFAPEAVLSDELAALKKELYAVKDVSFESIELVYNVSNQLIAVFPVVTDEMAAAYKQASLQAPRIVYLNLAYFYHVLPQVSDPDKSKKWDAIIKQLRQDTRFIYAYKDRIRNVDIRQINSEESPYIYVERDRRTGRIVPTELLLLEEDFGVSLRAVARDVFSQAPDPDKDQLVLTVFPTVYSPAAHVYHDKDYYERLCKDFDLRPEHDALVVGPGVGLEVWLAALKSQHKVWSIGINRFEIANLKYTAGIAGFEVEALEADNIITPEGNPRFGNKQFDRVIWNMPVYRPADDVDNIARAAGRLDGLWDGDYGGVTLQRFAKGLSSVLKKPDGQAIVWNERMLLIGMDHRKADRVEEILKAAGDMNIVGDKSRALFAVDPRHDIYSDSDSYLIAWPQDSMNKDGGLDADIRTFWYAFKGTGEQAAEAIKSRKTEVDYQTALGNSQVLFLGDNHYNIFVKGHVAEYAWELKRLGITHYAIEAPQDPAIDAINKNLSADLRGVRLQPEQGFTPSLYEQAVRAFAQAGIIVVPVDISSGKARSDEYREEKLYENIKAIFVQEPQARIAVLIGSLHASKTYLQHDGDSLRMRLNKAGITTSSVVYTGGFDVNPEPFIKAVRSAGLAGQDFMISESNLPPGASFSGGEFDYIVYIGLDGGKTVLMSEWKSRIEETLEHSELSDPAWLGRLNDEIVATYNKGLAMPVFSINTETEVWRQSIKQDLDIRELLSPAQLREFERTSEDSYVYLTIGDYQYSRNPRGAVQPEGYSYKIVVAKKKALNSVMDFADVLDINEDSRGEKGVLFLWKFNCSVFARGRTEVTISQQAVHKDLAERGFVSALYPVFVDYLIENFGGSGVFGTFTNEKSLHLFRKHVSDAVPVGFDGNIGAPSWGDPQLWAGRIPPADRRQDGGTVSNNVAGIDFRALPCTDVPGTLPTSLITVAGLANRILSSIGKTASVLQPADIDRDWAKIDQSVNAGAIPDVSSLEGYVRSCCQLNRIAQERDKVLLCIAQILRLEEDTGRVTEPRLKKLLVLLDSPA